MKNIKSFAATVAVAAAFSLGTNTAIAQRPSETARGGTSMQVQPKIMVIPFVKAGEDLRTVLEADIKRRVAITSVKEGFDNNNFSTVDFLQVVRSLPSDQLVMGSSQSDIKSRIIEQSRCDIYVEVEINPSIVEGAQFLTLITTSYLASNGTSLSNKTTNVGPFAMNVPPDRIVARAVADKLPDFLLTMNNKFTGFIEEGVPIRVEFSVAKGAKDLTRLVGPDKEELADVIEMWVKDNAWKNNYHQSGRTPLRLMFDEIRIPMFDPKTKNNFNASQFSLELARYLRTLSVASSRSMTGGVIYVEIQ